MDENNSNDPGWKGVPKENFNGIGSPLLGLGRITFNASASPVPEVGGAILPQASECALYYCVQTLDVSVSNNKLETSVRSSWRNESGYSNMAVYLTPPQGNESFLVSDNSNLPLISLLENVFSVNMTSTYDKESTPEQIAETNKYSSDVAQALWFVDDLDGFMANIADRMTDAIRVQSSDKAHGKMYRTVTHVWVKWEWLILPIVLVIGSFLLLIMSIIASQRHHILIWKSDILAVLFHGVPPKDQTISTHRSTDLKAAAEQMKVQLRQSSEKNYHLA